MATVLLQEPFMLFYQRYEGTHISYWVSMYISYVWSSIMYIEQEWKHFPYKHVGDYEDFGG